MAATGATLIADVGGTAARFALVRTTGLAEDMRLAPVSDFPRFDAALDAYIAALALDPRSLAGMVVAVAGPVRDGTVSMTNAAWRLDRAVLSTRFGGIPVRLMNDVAAVALALPFLKGDDLATVRPGAAAAEALPLLAINAGTGLGAALAVPNGTGWTPLATEAGHTRLAARDEVELRLFRGFRTIEEVIAGPGWQRFRNRLNSQSQDPPGGGLTLPDASRLYSRPLGRFAGDMVLATGAWGGVYFCGGVLKEWESLIDRPELLAGFNGDSPMSGRLQSVPLHRVMLPEPALKGLALAEKRE